MLLVLGPAVLLLAIACETLWRNRYMPQWVARKVLHVGAVGACALVPFWLEDLALLRIIVIVCELVLIWLVLKGHLFEHKGGQRSWGIVLFPFAYLILLFLEQERWLIALPMTILAFSDAIAAAVGNLWGRDGHRLTGDPKTVIGSAGFFITTLILLLAFPSFTGLLTGMSGWQTWAFLITITLMLTAMEAMGSRGWDNFFIPLAAWLLIRELDALPMVLRDELATAIGIAMILAMAFLFLTVRMGWLRTGGAIAAALIGLWVIYFAGQAWLIPLFLFLMASTFIGRMYGKTANLADSKHGKARDAIQVLCNGAIYAAIPAILDHPLASVAMAASIAISAADTWASEIGIAFRGTTRDIIGWNKVPPGLSGGISLAGSAGALVGSFVFGLLGAGLVRMMEFFWPMVLLITVSGVAGMLLDSVLGSRFQRKYMLEDGTVSDRPLIAARLVPGRRSLNNDLVNLLSNGIITGAVILLLELMHGWPHPLAGIP